MIETLYHNEWLSLKRVCVPERGINGYVFSHEERCRGEIIAVLLFRYIESGVEYGLRCECTPCWAVDTPIPSALTGGVEKDSTPIQTLWVEIREESGYRHLTKLHTLGECRGTKSTDTIYYLYGADVTGIDPGEAEGDGSRLEAEASIMWTMNPVWSSPDPLVGMLVARLQGYLKH